jgi:cardiolipin synthase
MGYHLSRPDTIMEGDVATNGQQQGIDDTLGTPDNPSRKILTVANVITVCRLLLTIVFLVLFIRNENRYIALAIYAVAACTDWLDGQIARRTQTVSWFGKILDPIVDRALLFTGVLGLMIRGELPVWVACIVIGRDVYLGIGALIVRRYRERPIDVVYIGKVTTALLMFGFCDLLLGAPVIEGLGLANVSWLPLLNSQAAPAGLLFVYAGVVCSILTACIYTYKGVLVRRETLAGRGAEA